MDRLWRVYFTCLVVILPVLQPNTTFGFLLILGLIHQRNFWNRQNDVLRRHGWFKIISGGSNISLFRLIFVDLFIHRNQLFSGMTSFERTISSGFAARPATGLLQACANASPAQVQPAQLGWTWFVAVVFVSRFIYRTFKRKMHGWLMAGLFLLEKECLFGFVSVVCLFCASRCPQVRGTVVLACWLWRRLLNAGQNCIRVPEWSS